MKTLINKNLIFVTSLVIIFAFVVMIPISAKAETQWVNPSNGWGGIYDQNYSNKQVNPVPVIYSITPNSAYICSGATSVLVLGQNFIPDSIVRWNGSSRVTTYVNSTKLYAQLTDSDICGSGNYVVTVHNPAPGGGLSNGVYFTLSPKPVSTYVAPTTTKKTTSTTSTKKTIAPKETEEEEVDACATETDEEKDNSSLAAGAIFGSDSFLPNTFAQWLVLFILVLLAIVLFRKLYAKKYKTQPLKHA